ncbi:MAG: glycosyltransferase family 9 protein [Chitinophagales bacterium]|nr:glycosyltransferase family 9 protein [Chitinophagales bacterium]
MQKFLIIQTAFIGDVVLATALVEKLARFYPDAQIDFLVRKGNESLLQNNPHLHEVLIWNKKEKKTRNLFGMLKQIRRNRYDKVINVQRFFSTGLLTAFSGAGETIGFNKNPLSFLFSRKITHAITKTRQSKHEVERNNDLIASFTDDSLIRPVLYPSEKDREVAGSFAGRPYVTISPGSVWFTKKFPTDKWIDLIRDFPAGYSIYLLGGPDNKQECEQLREQAGNTNVTVLAGRLSFLQSAALMKNAVINYVNDSGPLHFASAVNAPVAAIFCSTVPAFGFTPLSDRSFIIETTENLPCRPCGLHGHRECPEKHFRCARTIQVGQLLNIIPPVSHV